MRICLRRREFVTGLGGAAAWPIAARAQQRALPVVGCVGVQAAEAATERQVAFRQGLGEAGYSEGRNVTVEYHFLDGKFDRRGPRFPGNFQGVGRKPHSLHHGRAESP
jgi:putative ABC transport system substrate-binding protein